MNQAEYRRKTKPGYYERSWPLTIICALLAVFIISGIYAAWRYLAHDSFLIFAVILPAALIAFALIIAALNGRRYVINEVLVSAVELLYFWH